ncbi:hypothetical protein SO802_027597 [Lithocarpus litseifolius]|uniref:Gelsolin-like domain-containing protein n=1 Tax=Lithocarpus litseifolius TaxID=425828 RepID=A0AAW2C5G4_9ROSI
MKSVFHGSYLISRLFPPYNLITTTANGEFESWMSCTPGGANQMNYKALGKHDTRLDTPFGFVLFNQNNEMDSLQIEILFLWVGLSGKTHSLQRDLNNLAGAGDTSKKKGFHIILTESIVALLRHQNYWISGYSSVKQKRGVEAVEREFKQLSAEEREKFEIESLANVDNIKVQRTFIPKDNKLRKDYIVVTLVVAVKGAPNLPAIRSTEDLRKALHHLNSITSRETLAVEVLWTPQVEHDTLSEDELLEKYPILRPI